MFSRPGKFANLSRRAFLACPIFTMTSRCIYATGIIQAPLEPVSHGKDLTRAMVGPRLMTAGSATINVDSVSGGSITHGIQLTIADVGPWKLQGVSKGSEVLSALTGAQLAERVCNDPNWGRPSWIPGTNYVYNNDPSNHGGIVPAGGMVIDGYNVPAGTWVVQFRDTSAGQMIIQGNSGDLGPAWPGVLFRGCRMRSNWTAPGCYNGNAIANNGKIWFMYCDAGGTDIIAPNTCDSAIESQGNGPNDRQFIIRCYLSTAATLAFGRNNGDAFIENYGEIVPEFKPNLYHLNGLANGGGQTATLWLRNHLSFSPRADGVSKNPYYKPQNDVIQMAADGGGYPGTGINLDGSKGYQIRDNYIGGANYCLQLGVDKNNTSAVVSNVVVTGNKFTTYWFSRFGETGICYKTPTWGVQGNVWSNNIYADDYGSGAWSYTTGNAGRQYPLGNGPNVGATISAP